MTFDLVPGVKITQKVDQYPCIIAKVEANASNCLVAIFLGGVKNNQIC